MQTAIVEVPKSDSLDLEVLAGHSESELGTSSRLDGETVAQVLLALSPTSMPVLVAWIKARAERQKAYRVSIDGIEYSGFSEDEVKRLHEALNKAEDAEE